MDGDPIDRLLDVAVEHGDVCRGRDTEAADGTDELPRGTGGGVELVDDDDRRRTVRCQVTELARPPGTVHSRWLLRALELRAFDVHHHQPVVQARSQAVHQDANL